MSSLKFFPLYLLFFFYACQDEIPKNDKKESFYTINTLSDTITQLYPPLDTMLIPARAREIFPPSKIPYTDQGLQIFIQQLKKAVQDKNIDFIYTSLDESIELTFSGAKGLRNFKQLYKLHDSDDKFWKIANRILEIGGSACHTDHQDKNRHAFVFPYVFNLKLDNHTQYSHTAVVTEENVKVRATPNLKSKIIGQLSYEVVIFEHSEHIEPRWYKIKTLNHQLIGYIQADELYCPVDYRLFLGKIDGVWKITRLVSGLKPPS